MKIFAAGIAAISVLCAFIGYFAPGVEGSTDTLQDVDGWDVPEKPVIYANSADRFLHELFTSPALKAQGLNSEGPVSESQLDVSVAEEIETQAPVPVVISFAAIDGREVIQTVDASGQIISMTSGDVFPSGWQIVEIDIRQNRVVFDNQSESVVVEY